MPRRFKSKRRPRRSFASRVKSIVSRASETKHINSVSGSWDNVSSSGTTIDITSLIDRGTHDYQRIGDEAKVTKVHMNRMFRLVAGVTTPAATVRMIVAKAKGRNLTNTDMPAFHAPCNLDLMYVLADKLFTITGTEAVGGASYVPATTRRITFSKFWKNGLSVQYSSGSTTVAKNQLVTYWIADNNSIVEEAGFTSIYFKEM